MYVSLGSHCALVAGGEVRGRRSWALTSQYLYRNKKINKKINPEKSENLACGKTEAIGVATGQSEQLWLSCSYTGETISLLELNEEPSYSESVH